MRRSSMANREPRRLPRGAAAGGPRAPLRPNRHPASRRRAPAGWARTPRPTRSLHPVRHCPSAARSSLGGLRAEPLDVGDHHARAFGSDDLLRMRLARTQPDHVAGTDLDPLGEPISEPERHPSLDDPCRQVGRVSMRLQDARRGELEREHLDVIGTDGIAEQPREHGCAFGRGHGNPRPADHLEAVHLLAHPRPPLGLRHTVPRRAPLRPPAGSACATVA